MVPDPGRDSALLGPDTWQISRVVFTPFHMSPRKVWTLLPPRVRAASDPRRAEGPRAGRVRAEPSCYRGPVDEEEDRPAPTPCGCTSGGWAGSRTEMRGSFNSASPSSARTTEIDDQLLLLEHEPVLTLGRYADEAHVRASPDELAARGIEVDPRRARRRGRRTTVRASSSPIRSWRSAGAACS